MEIDFIKKPCQHCPYRVDVKPFLHPDRGGELAFLPQNKYNEFFCHKTTEYDEESDSGEMLVVQSSKVCAGFLSLMAHELGKTPYDDQGFEPSDLVYGESYQMADAYEDLEAWKEISVDHLAWVERKDSTTP